MRNQIPSQIKGRATNKTRSVQSGLVEYGETIRYGSHASPSRFIQKNWHGTLPGTSKIITPRRAHMITQAPRSAFTHTGIEGCLNTIRQDFINELETQTRAAEELIHEETSEETETTFDKTFDQIETAQDMASWYKQATRALQELKAS